MARTFLMVLGFAAFAHAQTDSVKTLRKDAEREARSDSKVGCKELTDETQLACVESFTRGLKVDCFSLVTALKMSAKQAKGTLFKTGGPAKDVQVADAACRVHLKSITRARKKSAELTDAAAAPAECQDLKTLLEQDCFPGFVQTGTFTRACEQVFAVLHMNAGPMVARLRAKNGEPEDPAWLCKGPLALYRKFGPAPDVAP